MRVSSTAALLNLLFISPPSQAAPSKVLLSKVKSLTLYADKPTSHRRVSAIPQLKCIGGNAKSLYEIDVMRCKNSGSEYDAEDIQWTCTASLPTEFKLGSTDVICEGYAGPDDPYVLKGSCGVQYRLMLTEAGEEKYGKRGKKRWGEEQKGESILGDVFTVLFWLAFAAILFTIVTRILGNLPGGQGRAGQRRRPGFGGGGGGGGPDDPYDRPPPYSARPSRKPSARTGSSTRRDAGGVFGGWRPGFWSGAATGAAAGYAMGNQNNNRDRRAYESYAEPGPSNWFGGRSNTNSYGTRASSSSSSGPSSSRHESTGFGGTSRR